MTKEQRIDYLKKLANSPMGEALKEHFEELIENLVDARNFPKDNFEMEGKASIKAVAILQKILRDLELLKRRTKQKTKNPYM